MATLMWAEIGLGYTETNVDLSSKVFRSIHPWINSQDISHQYVFENIHFNL